MYRKQTLICITIIIDVTGEPQEEKEKKHNLGDQI